MIISGDFEEDIERLAVDAPLANDCFLFHCSRSRKAYRPGDRAKTSNATLSIILVFWRPARRSQSTPRNKKRTHKRAGRHRFDA
jgi:hypothetical protein